MTTTSRSRTRKPAQPPADPEPTLVAEPVPPKETALPGTNGNGSRPPETFRIRFLLGPCWYAVTPLRVDPSVMLKAYRLHLLTVDGNSYDVGIKADGKPSCECLGFLNYGRPCRHLRCLRAAGMIDFEDPQPGARPATSANGHAQVLPDSKPDEADPAA
jgi:hypothetical protein